MSKRAVEIYPVFGHFHDYQPILDSLGTILAQADDIKCQGDSLVMCLRDGKYGFLHFGWGSCSQNRETISDVQVRMDGLITDMKWFDSKEDCMSFIRNRDWELRCYADRKTKTGFVNAAALAVE